MNIAQRRLSEEQVSAFYHDDFVATQVEDFAKLTADRLSGAGAVVDLGGGCGLFADAITQLLSIPVRVIDLDEESVIRCREKGLEATVGDAIHPEVRGDEAVVCFNMILHHLVAQTEGQTRQLQSSALETWRGRSRYVFINEYIYDSWFGGLAGSMIYRVTKSKVLSRIASVLARLAPSLRANTFGVGVRFRSGAEWRDLFHAAGYEVVGSLRGTDEEVSLARRALMIRCIHRDSFLLAPLGAVR